MAIQIVCDKCNQPFEVDSGTGADRAECPYCGDINRIPVTANPAAAQGRPSRRTAGPTGDTAAAGEAGEAGEAEATGERRLAVVRAAMFRAHPFWYSLMVLLFVGGLVAAVMGAPLATVGGPLPGLAITGVAALWWLVWWAAPHRWVKLIITTKRTIRQEGIVVRRTSEVLHNHIRNVKIEQTFLNRLLGVGRLSIDAAGGSDEEPIEIEMRHVPRPYQVKELIDRYREL